MYIQKITITNEEACKQLQHCELLWVKIRLGLGMVLLEMAE